MNDLQSHEFNRLKKYFRKQQQPQRDGIISESLKNAREQHKKEIAIKLGKLQKEIDDLKQISDAIN